MHMLMLIAFFSSSSPNRDNYRVIIVTAALVTHMHTLWIISGVMHAAI